MAIAWDQARTVGEINRTLGRATLASTVGRRLKIRVDALDDGALLQLSRNAHGRIKQTGAATTLAGTVATSALKNGLVSTAFRRAVRRGGTAGRALGAASLSTQVSARVTTRVVESPDEMLSFAAARLPSGTVLVDTAFTDSLMSALAGESTSTRSITVPASATRPVTVRLSARERTRATTLLQGATRRAAAITSGTASPMSFAIGTPIISSVVASPLIVRPALTVATASSELRLAWAGTLIRAALDPDAQIAARLRARITAPDAAWGDRNIPSSMAVTPEFTDPAYEMLVAYNQEFLMPGCGDVPADTIALAAVNTAFVEAFLLGANQALASEFLWREYPADLTGTWLRRFWDARSAANEPIADINPVADWDEAPLGEHQAGVGADATLVLLIKGELLRRYPDTTIYAVPAAWSEGTRIEDTTGEAILPVFGGQLGRDAVFLGFTLDLTTARGSRTQGDGTAGYFFVLEENPSGPRFGLDVADAAAAGTTPGFWNDACWGHLADSADTLDALRYASIGGRLSGLRLRYETSMFEETWGTNAAAMARITYQRPIRLLIHADSMLAEQA